MPFSGATCTGAIFQMIAYHINFALKSAWRVSFYGGVLVFGYRIWNAEFGSLFYNILTLVLLGYLVCEVTGVYINKYRALVDFRKGDFTNKHGKSAGIEQIGRYWYFYYDNGRKRSNKYTTYMAAYAGWTKILT